jgi:hypothetical protein
MATIITRAGKGSPLTNTEVDANFTNLNTNKVEGPTASTDNALARFDGTTGKVVQNSSVTVDDSGNLTASTGAFTTLSATTSVTLFGRMNPSTITTNQTIASGYNAGSFGPITIAEGTTVTLNTNSNWSIL